MPYDSDVALLGTGIAPLIAANHLLIQGKSVLLLNPDLDFYLEDSELPLDPLLETIPTPSRLSNSSPETALETLRPQFPGAIEFWSNQLNAQANTKQNSKQNSKTSPNGFHDLTAPHIHERGRLWVTSPDKHALWNWEELEDLYVEASDAQLNPQILEGISAARRFPGFTPNLGSFPGNLQGNLRGLYLPKLCDVDIVRYRNGLLEYMRERLGPERVICSVNSVEWMPEAVRFHSGGTLRTAKLREGMLVFWTPRLSSWILSQAKKAEVTPKLPKGVRIWEQWSLNSREKVDPHTIGMFNNMAIWADFEGSPPLTGHKLAVLRAGPLVEMEGIQLPQGGLSWASGESFGALSTLCHNFLKWDRFSIRNMRARAIFDWGSTQGNRPGNRPENRNDPQLDNSWWLSESEPRVRVIPACDGPLIDIVRTARKACEYLQNISVAQDIGRTPQ